MSLGQSNSVSNALAADASSLNQLKFQAGQSSPAAIKETAKQFESLFMRELIKKHARGHHEIRHDGQPGR